MIIFFQPHGAKIEIPACYSTSREVRRGPGGQDGIVFSTGQGKTGYYPDEQTWREIDGVWVGLSKDKLNPKTLLRHEVVDGHPVTLENGQEWLIPVARSFPVGTQLPETLFLGADGTLVQEIIPRFAAFAQRAENVFEFFFENKTLLKVDAWNIAIEALAINYYIGAREVSALRLLTTANIKEILGAIVDMPAIKKKAAERDGGSMNDGGVV